MSGNSNSGTRRIDWLAWWQLLRAANVFTAISNVIAGFLLVRGEWQPVAPLLLLTTSSALLYLGGMVLNDVCDAEVDAHERPERPIPAGRVSKNYAYFVAVALLVWGLAIAIAARAITGSGYSYEIAAAILVAIVSYDAFAKSTPIGPFVMGCCRGLNVLLGASLTASLGDYPYVWMYAAALGVYTMGITYVARSEHLDPSGHIKKHVGTLIQMFIVLDAAVSALAAGWVSGLAVLSLLIPTRLLARKLPMT